MKRLSDIVTVSLGAAALVTLVHAKDRPTPTPGVRTAMERIGYKTQAPLTSSQRPAGSRAQVSAPPCRLRRMSLAENERFSMVAPYPDVLQDAFRQARETWRLPLSALPRGAD